jgi:uncharacterized protein (DUF608 family)
MLFPTDLPQKEPVLSLSKEWAEFSAAGFRVPVCGVIHRGSLPPVCGVPLGGVDTGCLDLEATGLLGYCTIFNSLVPRRGPLNLPFLGVSVGMQTWICTTLILPERRGTALTYYDLRLQGRYQGLRTASEIFYWGHYPVADMEFLLDDAPVSIGLRAWTPFIPGDLGVSNTPGAVFEVHLRSRSSAAHKGTLVFSFPGPSEAEAGTTHFDRRELTGELQGVAVTSERASYALGVIGAAPVRTGGALGLESTAWATIEHGLPYASQQAGATVALDFSLEPGEEQVIRFVLAWHSPIWMGSGSPMGGGNAYTHTYAQRHQDAEAVARFLAQHHEELWQRILAWQSVLYAESALPPWLRDALINILHLITETSVWAQAKPPIGDWCRPEDGLYGMSESPRWCPQIECIPCSFYGNLPLVYFFPSLALSTLRAYKAYQFPSGAAPWVFGGVTVGTRAYELALPSPGYAVKPQTTLDGACYAEMVDKLWQRTGDPAIVEEFYESVKKNAIFTMGLRSGAGPTAVVSMPDGNNAYDWYELCDLYGIVPHIGGAHLAQLRLAQRMAETAGDTDFVRQCQEWLDQGSAVLEEHGWAGDCYLLFNEVETGKKNDVIMAHQLDGEWIARFHGLPGVFPTDRVETTLETLKRTSLAASEYGAAVFHPGKESSREGWDPGYWTMRGVHPPGTLMLAMLYMYNGQVDFGLDLARRVVQEVLRRGWMWDWPVVLDGSEPRIGFDYYQNLILWSLPAAILGGDLRLPCRPGGLVDRIIRAGTTAGH